MYLLFFSTFSLTDFLNQARGKLREPFLLMLGMTVTLI